MGTFFWGFLIVIVIPLAEGVLLALWLRDLHARHPLPLGGVINPSLTRKPQVVDTADADGKPARYIVTDTAPSQDVSNVQTSPPQNSVIIDGATANDPTGSPVGEENVLAPREVSVFDDAENIPENLPVNEVLDLMTMAAEPGIPDDFESIIEKSVRSDPEMPPEIGVFNDDMDADDLHALAAALPRDKIDFTQELDDEDSTSHEAISQMAKDVLGENFNFDALERKPDKYVLPPQESGGDNAEVSQNATNTDEAENVALDIQEDESGNVQVSSPFIFNVVPQLEDFAMPQTILSTFSDDWIQETDVSVESIEGDTSKFIFSEESRPMFVRKKKSS